MFDWLHRSCNARYEACQGIISTLQATVSRVCRERDKLERTQDSNRAKIHDANLQINGLQTEIEQLRTSLSAHKATITTMRMDLADALANRCFRKECTLRIEEKQNG